MNVATAPDLAPGHPGYPRALAGIKGEPPGLYVKGNAAALLGPLVAVVGTRQASSPGRNAAFAIGERLAAMGLVVVSGLAEGIDGQGHRGALAGGGQTAAVLAHGLHMVYPPSHRDLAADIVATHGALVSELPEGSKVSKPALVRRNRIIAGLSRALVLVESMPDGGAMHAVRFAREYGRPVFAVWSTDPTFLRGGAEEAQRRHGATLVRGVGELMKAVEHAVTKEGEWP